MRSFAALCVALACPPLGGPFRPPERFTAAQRAWVTSDSRLHDPARDGFLTGKLQSHFPQALAPSEWDSVGCLHSNASYVVGTVVTNDTVVIIPPPFWFGYDGDHRARVFDFNMSAPMYNVGANTSQRLMMDPNGEFHSCSLTTYRTTWPRAHPHEAHKHNDIIIVVEQGAKPYRVQVTPNLLSDVLLHVQMAQLWFERLNHMLMHPGHLHASGSDLHVAPSSHYAAPDRDAHVIPHHPCTGIARAEHPSSLSAAPPLPLFSHANALLLEVRVRGAGFDHAEWPTPSPPPVIRPHCRHQRPRRHRSRPRFPCRRCPRLHRLHLSSLPSPTPPPTHLFLRLAVAAAYASHVTFSTTLHSPIMLAHRISLP